MWGLYGESPKFRDFPREAGASRVWQDLLAVSSLQCTAFLRYIFRQEKRAQRLTFWVRRPPGGAGSLPREGVVAEKVVPSLESLSSLGFEERNLGCPGNFTGMSRTPAQRALRDRLMSRGKNCLPTVSRQFLTRNYPRPNCLLKCLPNCLSPTREGFLSSFKINPAVRVIARQVRDKNCLAAIFAPRHQSVSSGPLGGGVQKSLCKKSSCAIFLP